MGENKGGEGGLFEKGRKNPEKRKKTQRIHPPLKLCACFWIDREKKRKKILGVKWAEFFFKVKTPPMHPWPEGGKVGPRPRHVERARSMAACAFRALEGAFKRGLARCGKSLFFLFSSPFLARLRLRLIHHSLPLLRRRYFHPSR